MNNYSLTDQESFDLQVLHREMTEKRQADRIKAIVLLVMFITLTNITGCARVGQEFAASRVMELTIGETTHQEVREIFGAPWRTGIEDGLPTWTYGKYHYYLFSADETQDLVIRFDKQKIVRSYTFNTTSK